jgi:hypothetical protein
MSCLDTLDRASRDSRLDLRHKSCVLRRSGKATSKSNGRLRDRRRPKCNGRQPVRCAPPICEGAVRPRIPSQTNAQSHVCRLSEPLNERTHCWTLDALARDTHDSDDGRQRDEPASDSTCRLLLPMRRKYFMTIERTKPALPSSGIQRDLLNAHGVSTAISLPSDRFRSGI